MAASSSPLSIFHDVPGPGDRRQTLRHKIHSPAYASFDGIGGGMVLDLTEITDISEEGMCIQTNGPLKVDRTLNLVLDLAETKTYINATGHVVWSSDNGRSGIRFEKLSETSARQLKTWLFFNTLTALSKSKNPPTETLSEAARFQGSIESPEAETEGLGQARNGDVPTTGQEEYEERFEWAADAPTLNEIRQDIEALGGEVDMALDLLANRTRLLTRASGTAIALAAGDEMVCRASSGDAPPVGARFHVGAGFSGECVRTGKLQWCEDSETDELVDRESCRALGIRSMIAYPVLSSGEVIGLIEVFSAQANSFEEGDAVALGRLSDIVAQVGSPPAIPEPAESLEITDEPAPVVVEPAVEPAREAQVVVEEPSFRRETLLLITAIALIVLAIGASVVALMRNRRINSESQPASVVNQQEMPQTQPAPLDELRRFADQGDPVAQFALGARYAQGDGVKQDYAEAVKWFKKAANQGHVVAQATLGAYYWAGRGVSEDLSKAYFWSVLARAGGDEASKYRVAALTSRMSRPQVMQAEQQANEWLKQHQGSGDSRAEQ